jgi:hypothetical protein
MCIDKAKHFLGEFNLCLSPNLNRRAHLLRLKRCCERSGLKCSSTWAIAPILRLIYAKPLPIKPLMPMSHKVDATDFNFFWLTQGGLENWATCWSRLKSLWASDGRIIGDKHHFAFGVIDPPLGGHNFRGG